MKPITFIILTIAIMALVGFYVRAGNDKTYPPQAVNGPATPHEITGEYTNCLNCHSDITASHDERFGAGNYSECLSCHKKD